MCRRPAARPDLQVTTESGRALLLVLEGGAWWLEAAWD